MIKETINSIIEAENKALDIEHNALEQARIILNNAELEIEKLNIKAIESNKELTKKVNTESDVKANEAAGKLLAARKAEIDSQSAKFNTKFNAAVDLVVRSLK